jgi:hypothetical protein
MKNINILELHRKINAKKALQNEIYETILSKCHKRIELITDNQKMNCFFDIPIFIIGFPLYDLNKCVEFVMNALIKNGFLVKYYFPTYLYISWDFKEISKEAKPKPSSPPSQPPNNSYKSLLASSIQKNNGKIVLNL